MQLSPNFTLAEFTRTGTGLPNTPSVKGIERLRILAKKIVQPIRDQVGGPVKITSGYRSHQVNQAVGGASNSQHITYEAADLQSASPKVSNRDIFFAALNTDFDQLIWEFGDDNEPAWVHVSYNMEGGQRRSIQEAVKENGVTKYYQLDPTKKKAQTKPNTNHSSFNFSNWAGVVHDQGKTIKIEITHPIKQTISFTNNQSKS